jgi:uncharacterized membrane protein
MLDVIFVIKFVHVLAACAMLGTWLALVIFMELAHRSGNTSVVALTSQFVVRAEWMIMAAAVALQPLSGIPLAYAIGVDPLGEFWILASLGIYAAIAAAWLWAVRLERRIRDVTREAALEGTPLRAEYRRLFRLWRLLAGPILLGMAVVVALMIWQPRFD